MQSRAYAHSGGSVIAGAAAAVPMKKYIEIAKAAHAKKK